VLGDDGNPGTSESPFRTVSHALAVAGEGDLIQVRPGTYDADLGETFPLRPAPGQTLRGDPATRGEGAVPTWLHGAALVAPDQPRATIVGAAGATVEGFRIDADLELWTFGVFLGPGIDTTVAACTFGPGDLYGGIFANAPGAARILGNVFGGTDFTSYGIDCWNCLGTEERLLVEGNTFDGTSTGVELLGASEDNPIVRGNTFRCRGPKAIQVQAGRPLIESNVFERPDGCGLGAIHVTLGAPVVRRNTFGCAEALRNENGQPDLGTGS
jgi:hypothetical protein